MVITFLSTYGQGKPQMVHFIISLTFFKNKKGIVRYRRWLVSSCCSSMWAGGSGMLLLWMFLSFPTAKLQEILAKLTCCCASSFHQSTAPSAPGLLEIWMLIFIQLQLKKHTYPAAYTPAHRVSNSCATLPLVAEVSALPDLACSRGRQIARKCIACTQRQQMT